MSNSYGGSRSEPDYSSDYKEVESSGCSIDFHYDLPAVKTQPRPFKFCQQVTIEGDLIVNGDVIIKGNLTVSGTVKAPLFDGTATKAIVASSLG